MNIPLEISKHFDDSALVAAIAQDFTSGEVLMLAWMNREAFLSTLETGQVTYWSRSRNSLWRKGESSGSTQKLMEISYDCDGDALLLKVEQMGVACHTGERTCFHRSVTFTA
jgi:phosphoribosyl-AMP cyclohydrolase